MNTQSENRRALDVIKGENQPRFVKSFTSSTLKKTAGLSQKSENNRKIFSDNSNKNIVKSITSNNKAHYDVKEQTTIKEQSVIKNQVITKEEQEEVDSKEEQVDAEVNDTQEALKEEFFKDNETRYGKKDDAGPEEFREIVPILPIIVPKHLRYLYTNKKKNEEENEMNSNKTIGTKRPNEEPEPLAEKKLRTMEQTLFKENAPALAIKMNDETKQYDNLQEIKAKLAMLQTTQSLKEHQWNDPMLVAEYAGDIFGHLFDAEPKSMADPAYALNLQHEVTWKMRGVLIDWVIEIHYLFQLLPETLFLTVNIIDRFLSLRTVVLGKLQLVGITSLFIATKFEELVCPAIPDFLFMTDNAVKEDELIKAERFILQVLDFHLCYPNPVNFLRRVCSDELKCDIHTRTLAKYFMEISCIDHKFIGIRPSKIAAASLWLSKKMLAKGKWNSNLSKLAGYTPEDLKVVVENMLDFLSQPITHDAFFNKWSSTKLAKASIFVRDWVNRYYIHE